MKSDTLEERQRSEWEFHNRKLLTNYPTSYYAEGFTRPIFDVMINKLEPLQGKKILEIGCGTGWMTKMLASRGAKVWAFDISQEAVATARDYLASCNLSNVTHVEQMAAEKIAYDTEMFDYVVGKAVLHHLDLIVTLPQIKRVLKSNGMAVFMEPLGHNPLLNFYRYLTPNLRSVDERPMLLEQFAFMKHFFARAEHEKYYFTAMLALAFHFLGMKKLMLMTRDLLLRLGSGILTAIPAMRKHCWYSILMLEK